jgi:hypothetical protein
LTRGRQAAVKPRPSTTGDQGGTFRPSPAEPNAASLRSKNEQTQKGLEGLGGKKNAETLQLSAKTCNFASDP